MGKDFETKLQVIVPCLLHICSSFSRLYLSPILQRIRLGVLLSGFIEESGSGRAESSSFPACSCSVPLRCAVVLLKRCLNEASSSCLLLCEMHYPVASTARR